MACSLRFTVVLSLAGEGSLPEYKVQVIEADQGRWPVRRRARAGRQLVLREQLGSRNTYEADSASVTT